MRLANYIDIPANAEALYVIGYTVQVASFYGYRCRDFNAFLLQQLCRFGFKVGWLSDIVPRLNGNDTASELLL